MTNLYRIVPFLLAIALIYVGIKLLYRSRALAMRALASKLGFQYTKGNPRFWFLPKDHHPIPTSFRLRGFPVNKIDRTWNVIEGEKNGNRILILDSIMNLGAKKGSYSTFVAVRTDENPFKNMHHQERIAHSNGWTALYRIRYWQIPWTLSIQRIEELLNNFTN